MKTYWELNYIGNCCVVHYRRFTEDHHTRYDVSYELFEFDADIEDLAYRDGLSVILYQVIEHEGQTTKFVVFEVSELDFNSLSNHEKQEYMSKLIQKFENNKAIRLEPGKIF